MCSTLWIFTIFTKIIFWDFLQFNLFVICLSLVSLVIFSFLFSWTLVNLYNCRCCGCFQIPNSQFWILLYGFSLFFTKLTGLSLFLSIQFLSLIIQRNFLFAQFISFGLWYLIQKRNCFLFSWKRKQINRFLICVFLYISNFNNNKKNHYIFCTQNEPFWALMRHTV